MKNTFRISLNDILNKPFTFTKKPEYLPCDMRPLWRCSLILLIFQLVGRNGTCSFKKLHLINWLLKSDSNVTNFDFWLKNNTSLKPEVRLDPTLDKAIELLLGENFLTKENDKFSITHKGTEIANKIIESNILNKERDILFERKKKFSESQVDKIFQVK